MVYTINGTENYTRRKKIILTGGASGVQTNYQLKLATTYATAMQNDFDDTRFVKADMQTLIDAWLESKVNDTSADIWVEFPNSPSDGVVETEAYMYFGNAGVANYWDIGATFLFGDDAESGTYSDKWNDITGSGEYSTDQAYTGSKSIKFSATADQTSASKNTAAADAVFEAMVKNVGSNDYYTFMTARASQTAQTYYAYRSNYIGNAQLFKRISGTFGLLDQDASSDSVTTWHKWSVLCNGTSIKTYFDDALRNEATNGDIASGGIGTRGAASNNQYYDEVRIRKYVTNPPTYEFGTEEHQRRTPMMM